MPVINLSEGAAAELRAALGVAQPAPEAPTTSAPAPAVVPPVTATPAPAPTPAPAAEGYPKLVQFKTPAGQTVNVLALEPINPQWQPPIEAATFGGGDNFVLDPSNGDRVHMPRRSRDGYPLVYAVAPDGLGGSVAVGTPSVTYAGQSFNSDAEVADYIARTAGGPAPTTVSWDDVFARLRGLGK